MWAVFCVLTRSHHSATIAAICWSVRLDCDHPAVRGTFLLKPRQTTFFLSSTSPQFYTTSNSCTAKSSSKVKVLCYGKMPLWSGGLCASCQGMTTSSGWKGQNNEIIENKKMSPNIPELPGVWYGLVLVGSISSNYPYSKLGLKARF